MEPKTETAKTVISRKDFLRTTGGMVASAAVAYFLSGHKTLSSITGQLDGKNAYGNAPYGGTKKA